MPSRLLRILDRARLTPASPDVGPPSPKPVGFGLAQHLAGTGGRRRDGRPGLAAGLRRLAGGLEPRHFPCRWPATAPGRLGLPVLYTSIVAATLASGQFIASAAMSWMLTFWRRQSRDETDERSAQAAGRDPSPAALCPAGQCRMALDVEVLVDDLKPTDVILVSAGELIPADGRVLEGRGLVDERMVRGVEGLSANSPMTRSSLARRSGSASCTSRCSVMGRKLRPPHWPAQHWRRLRLRTAREPQRNTARRSPNGPFRQPWPSPASDSWSVTSRPRVPSCAQTTRPAQGWRSRSKRCRPLLFAFATAS